MVLSTDDLLHITEYGFSFLFSVIMTVLTVCEGK